jgi:hypothetical protein
MKRAVPRNMNNYFRNSAMKGKMGNADIAVLFTQALIFLKLLKCVSG